MTNADNWWQEIREESKAEAELETKVKILTSVLTQRFGNLSDDIRRQIDGAQTPQLDLWIDSMIGAPSLSDVFEMGSKRQH